LRAEVTAPIQNKLGQFANNQILRDIVEGRKNIYTPKIMDEGRVLICNQSKRMGEEPSRLLGTLKVKAPPKQNFCQSFYPNPNTKAASPHCWQTREVGMRGCA
jgi:hypothetical protein